MAYGKPSGHELRLRRAQEAMQIASHRCYPVHGEIIPLPDCDIAQAHYLGQAKLAFITEQMETQVYELPEFQTQYYVTKEDPLDAAAGRDDMGPTLVLSSANGRTPGGVFLTGGRGQEPGICRNSTLYASIASPNGVLLYLHNNLMQIPVDSDCMTLSPNVVVFRAGNGHLLDEPFTTAVITVPSPDKRHHAADVPQGILDRVMTQRIEKMILAAAYYGYRTLILGAWGCYSHQNDAKTVAGYFRDVLVEREYGRLFPRIVFAISDHHSNEKYDAFHEVLQDVLTEDARTPKGESKSPETPPKEIPEGERPLTAPILHINVIDPTAPQGTQELYCRLENNIVPLARAQCGNACPYFEGIGYGDVIECMWQDIPAEQGYYRIEPGDQQIEMKRVQNLISEGILPEEPSPE